MPTHTLSAYVLPGDSILDAECFVEEVHRFISSREWRCPDVWAVSQERADGEGELGLNLLLPEPYQEPTGWYQDVEAVVAFCVRARRELHRDFVIGLADEHGQSEDILEIDSDSPRSEYLRKFIGACGLA